jgi:CheY-like chemotaxis protein
MARESVHPFRRNSHRSGYCYTIVISLMLSALCLATALPLLPASQTLAIAQTPMPTDVPPPATAPDQSTTGITPEIILLLVLSAIALLTLPIGYFLFSRPPRTIRSLLLVSTDLETHKLVSAAARRTGYQTVQVYRYEDALEKLRDNSTLRMIAIDDSVPQYEVGLLVSALQRMPVGLRPLILIRDSSELGQTAFAHRAEVVLSRPLTEQSIEGAIRRVEERSDAAL